MLGKPPFHPPIDLHRTRGDALSLVELLRAQLARVEPAQEASLHVELAGLLEERQIETDLVRDEPSSGDVEAVIGVGGDGTVLRAARLAVQEGVPIAGVNVGVGPASMTRGVGVFDGVNVGGASIVLVGDAADEELLLEENIDNVDVFCALTNSEEANILSSMLSKRLGAHKVMARPPAALFTMTGVGRGEPDGLTRRSRGPSGPAGPPRRSRHRPDPGRSHRRSPG